MCVTLIPEKRRGTGGIITDEDKTMTKLSRVQRSVVIAVTSLLLGIMADGFFYHYPIGLNTPLYVLLFLLFAAVLIEEFDLRFNPANALFAIPAIFFAGMIAVIAADYLTFFNAVLMLGSLFLVTRYLTEEQFWGGSWFNPLLAGFETAMLGWLEPIPLLGDVATWLKSQRGSLKKGDTRALGAVLRGCLIAAPILVVFGALLSSADIVFRDILDDLVGWFTLDIPADWVGQLLFIAVFTWIAAAALKIMIQKPSLALNAAQNPLPDESGTPASPERAVTSARPTIPIRLGMIESGIVLGSVNLLFLAFVVIQAAYLFGGKSNITAKGYTYAEYARRGFFELVAVSLFTLLLVVVMDHITQRRPDQEMRFRGLVIGVVVLTLVILVSAFRRMSLYEDAYGFTQLRVITHVFMVWLGLLFLVLALDLFRVYPRLFWLGCIVVTAGFFATLDLMNVDAFIAHRNIERYHQTGKLDIGYLTTLSDDAIPEIATLLDDPTIREHREYQTLLKHLGWRLYDLDQEHDKRSLMGYHYHKDRAWHALNKRRASLEGYIVPTDSFYVD
jgi:hypothetical protein